MSQSVCRQSHPNRPEILRSPGKFPRPGVIAAGCCLLFISCLVGTALSEGESGNAADSRPGPAAVEETPVVDDDAPEPADKPGPAEAGAEKAPTENPYPGRFKAPDLDGGTGWLNTSGEISLKDLRGKIVLLDFWTYCCINCMHVLPDLKYLEKKYEKQLVVIGVHSAKFENEKESENIRRAILRYEIEHPVINDSEMTIWRKFGVNSWPTLVMLDPEGNYCGYLSGEGNREVLESVIDKVIAFHKSKRTLDETPVRFNLERAKAQPTPLRFPGKILADEAGGRLFIADSNHNRIVVAGLDGKLLDTIGTGAIGHVSGPYDQAQFDHPQGMALVGDRLYVADTENHLIREVDLKARMVKTLAGTGKQGHERRNSGELRKIALNSPWDLVHVDGKLYIAMAGPHQLWLLDLKTRRIGPYAGSGREDIRNGSLADAAMAQPSGITTDGEFLFVVDSEGSALRRVPLDPKQEITTVVGTSDLPNGRCLFEFGDRDGVGSAARLQHPLGVTYHAGVLYVADSYNHKIKKVDPRLDESVTYLGDGEPGERDVPPRFSEPAGVSVAGGVLYVADTNNHRIRTVELATGKTATLAIAGLAPPPPPKPSAAPEVESAKVVAVSPQRVVPGEALAFEAALPFPDGFKLNTLAPVSYRLKGPAGQTLIPADQLGERRQIDTPESGNLVSFLVPLAAKSGKVELRVTVSYTYCREGSGGLCKLGTVTWSVPIEVATDARDDKIKLTAERK